MARPALDVRQAALMHLSTLGDFRVLDRYFRKAVICIQAERKQPVFQNVFLDRPASAVELGQFHRVGLWSCRHNWNEFEFRGRAWGGCWFPTLHPPGATLGIFGRIAVGRAVLFSGRNRHLSAPVADEGDGEGEEASWLLGQGKLETRWSDLAGDSPSPVSRQGAKRPHIA